MFNFKILISIFFPIIFIFSFAVPAFSQETGIEKWIEDVSVDTQKGAIFNYTYQLEVSYKKKNKLGFGRKFTKTYKAVIPSRFNQDYIYTHPLILIKDSEKIVTQDAIDRAIESLVPRIERAESMADSPTEKMEDLTGGYWTIQLRAGKQQIKIDILKIFEIARFSNLQQKQIDGNEIISIDFSPYPSLVFDKSIKYITNIEGQIWIDPTSRRIIRVEGFPLGTFEQMRTKTDSERADEAVFFFLQKKVSEGFWFPNYVKLDFTSNSNIFKPVKLEFNFSDYQKSNTDIRTVNIRAPEEDVRKTASTEGEASDTDSTTDKDDNR